jgi:hypothetical protein
MVRKHNCWHFSYFLAPFRISEKGVPGGSAWSASAPSQPPTPPYRRCASEMSRSPPQSEFIWQDQRECLIVVQSGTAWDFLFGFPDTKAGVSSRFRCGFGACVCVCGRVQGRDRANKANLLPPTGLVQARRPRVTIVFLTWAVLAQGAGREFRCPVFALRPHAGAIPNAARTMVSQRVHCT